jgi:signal peptidase I
VVFALPVALIPLCAGIGIVRRRAWSAYGFALYEFAQILLVPVLLLRGGSTTAPLVNIGGALLIAAMLSLLFFFAGRSLEATGAKRGWAWPWIMVAVLSVLPFLFFQAFVMPTGSMEDTLLIGDRILVQRFPAPKPKRGYMVVFVYPIDRRQTFVKRIIGMPGDRIKIARKMVYRNGVPLNEPYAVHKTTYEDSYRDNFPSEANVYMSPAGTEMLQKHVVNGEVVVPDGKYFVLGDNRDSSLDSRYWGFVSLGDFIGKPLLIYDSKQTIGRRQVRWERIFKLL